MTEEQEEKKKEELGGAITGQAIVDLSHLRSPEDLAAITRIEGAGAVVVPASLAGAYAAIPTSGIGNTIYVHDGANVRAHVGSLTVGGDGLGAPEDVLVVVGMLLVTSPVTGPLPHQVSVVGGVLAPRGSEAALGPVLAGGSGGVVYYPYTEGQAIKLHTGQVKLSGASLANAGGQAGDILVAAGQVVVTGAVGDVGYAQIFVAGQLVAPAASRDALEPRMEIAGQVVWYRGSEPWIVMGDTSVGPDFFRLLDHSVSLVLFGNLTIEPGVSEATLQEKVVDITMFGDIVAPAELKGLLQVLAADAHGTIRTDDGPGS